MPVHCENLVIGSGEAGKCLAWTLGRQGQRTLIVERDRIGGACPNVACLPSKNVIHSAKVMSLVRRAAEFGISIKRADLDMSAVTRRKEQMIEALATTHAARFAASDVEVMLGEARFIGERTVQVALRGGGVEVIRGTRVFIAVGTRAIIPPVPGLRESQPLTHVSALNLDRLPAHLAILGGGYVGLEFAQAFRRLGSRVTIIQRGPQLLNREDPEIAAALTQLMHDEGIEVLLDAEVESVAGSSGDSVRLQVRSSASMGTISASDVLVAVGRAPNTDSLDAERGNVELESTGFVRVDDQLRTTAPQTWAMGECAGSPQFTHVSFDDFRIVRDNLAGGTRGTRGTRDRVIPYCLFTDPQLAHVGLTERQATARGTRYRIAKIPMASVLRTATNSESRGFMKALIAEDDRILGFTAFGAEASELVAAVQTAMLGRLPYTLLRDGIFAHPTTSEGLTVLFANALAEADGTHVARA